MHVSSLWKVQKKEEEKKKQKNFSMTLDSERKKIQQCIMHSLPISTSKYLLTFSFLHFLKHYICFNSTCEELTTDLIDGTLLLHKAHLWIFFHHSHLCLCTIRDIFNNLHVLLGPLIHISLILQQVQKSVVLISSHIF